MYLVEVKTLNFSVIKLSFKLHFTTLSLATAMREILATAMRESSIARNASIPLQSKSKSYVSTIPAAFIRWTCQDNNNILYYIIEIGYWKIHSEIFSLFSLVKISIAWRFPICFRAWNFTIFCLGLYKKRRSITADRFAPLIWITSLNSYSCKTKTQFLANLLVLLTVTHARMSLTELLLGYTSIHMNKNG